MEGLNHTKQLLNLFCIVYNMFKPNVILKIISKERGSISLLKESTEMHIVISVF